MDLSSFSQGNAAPTPENPRDRGSAGIRSAMSKLRCLAAGGRIAKKARIVKARDYFAINNSRKDRGARLRPRDTSL
jgi:hypothetical protein